MKNKLILLLAATTIFINTSGQSFKSLYFKSLHFLEVYDYSAALPILQEMKVLDPENHIGIMKIAYAKNENNIS